MFYVLLFCLLLGFAIVYSLKSKGILKNENRYLLFKAKTKKYFYPNKNFLVNDESKELLSTCKKSAKKLDEILTKIRFNCPQKYVYVPPEKLASNKIDCLPVFMCDENVSPFELQMITEAKKHEDFFACVFYKTYQSYFNNYPNIVFEKEENRNLFSICKTLNINYDFNVTKQKFFDSEFNFKINHQKQKMLADGYLLTKFMGQNFDCFAYNFFAGERITYLLIVNKANSVQNLSYNYFFDLSNQKINYLFFKRNKNFLTINNIFFADAKYFNFSCGCKYYNLSYFKGKENSNLPCVNMFYEELFKPKQQKEFWFMYSKKVYPLKLFNLSRLQNLSKSYLDEMFNLTIFSDNDEVNKIFNSQLKNRAMIDLLTSDEKIKISEDNILNLIQMFKNNMLDALCCYFSIKNKIIKENENSFVINPFAFENNFVIKISYKNVCKNIEIRRKNLQKPCLIVEGVRYYNQLEISKKHLLTDWNISVEC